MIVHEEGIADLVEYVKVDRFFISCHFKCTEKDKTIVSTVPFEPYEGTIKLSFKDILLHPLHSYNRYYHTPITIYGNNCHETIVLKAFSKVSNYFIWNQQENRYTYN